MLPPLGAATPQCARVFVITGPSGVGKGTLIRALLERVPELELAVSATTRQPRPGETQGVDYHFLTDEEFEHRVAGRRLRRARALLRPPLRHAARELEQRGPAAGRWCSRSRSRARARSARRCPRRSRSSSRRRRGGAAHAAGRPRHRRGRAGGAPAETAREELAAQREFAHVVVNDRLEDAAEELEGLRPRAASRAEPLESDGPQQRT